MAIRTPLKLDGSISGNDYREIDAIQTEAIRLYGLNPYVYLTSVASGGNLRYY